ARRRRAAPGRGGRAGGGGGGGGGGGLPRGAAPAGGGGKRNFPAVIRHHAWPFCPDGSAGRTDKPVCSSWCLAGAASSPGASLGRPIGAVCWRLQGARGGAGPLTLHAGEGAEGEAMTEDEWPECTHPAPMLGILRGKATDPHIHL